MLQLIKQFGSEAVFTPNELAILSTAFDNAWQQLEKSGVHFETDDEREYARRLLGKKIIDEAAAGERDHTRLTDSALLHYRKAQLREK